MEVICTRHGSDAAGGYQYSHHQNIDAVHGSQTNSISTIDAEQSCTLYCTLFVGFLQVQHSNLVEGFPPIFEGLGCI